MSLFPTLMRWARPALALALLAAPVSANPIPMNEAASPAKRPANGLPMQFPPIRERYAPSSGREGYANSGGANAARPAWPGANPPPRSMPWSNAGPPIRPQRAGTPHHQKAQGLPGNPATLSEADRAQFRRLMREARHARHAFTGRLMRERDALEALYERNPRPTPEAVGAIYGRIFAVQREMVEDRVRRANALYDLFQQRTPKEAAQPPSVAPRFESGSNASPTREPAPKPASADGIPPTDAAPSVRPQTRSEVGMERQNP